MEGTILKGRQQRTDTRRLLYWIEEREKIRCARAAGLPPPWTADKILREYRFTNVRREDDKVTRWILDKWVYPFADDPDLWFGCVIARFVNWPETLDELGYPVPWDPKHFLDVMAAREARGAKRYGGAYMIHADNTGLKRPTPVYQVEEVFGPLWAARAALRPRKGDTLEGYLAFFKPFSNMGNGFMPAQVIGDLKYVKPLRLAHDRMTFAVSGPGSRRGLNRLLGRPVDASLSERNWRASSTDCARVSRADLNGSGSAISTPNRCKVAFANSTRWNASASAKVTRKTATRRRRRTRPRRPDD